MGRASDRFGDCYFNPGISEPGYAHGAPRILCNGPGWIVLSQCGPASPKDSGAGGGYFTAGSVGDGYRAFGPLRPNSELCCLDRLYFFWSNCLLHIRLSLAG